MYCRGDSIKKNRPLNKYNRHFIINSIPTHEWSQTYAKYVCMLYVSFSANS